MTDRKVWAFFYGSNMNPDVLAKVGYVPEQVEVAILHGFDIRIEPLANLVPSDPHCVYGILATGTHEELERLYGRYVRDELGAIYLPEAVLCRKLDGTLIPALCYIAPPAESAPVSGEYLDRITGPARQLGFPDWYLDRLEQFRRKG